VRLRKPRGNDKRRTTFMLQNAKFRPIGYLAKGVPRRVYFVTPKAP
jgi:hypothetical protein